MQTLDPDAFRGVTPHLRELLERERELGLVVDGELFARILPMGAATGEIEPGEF